MPASSPWSSWLNDGDVESGRRGRGRRQRHGGGAGGGGGASDRAPWDEAGRPAAVEMRRASRHRRRRDRAAGARRPLARGWTTSSQVGAIPGGCLGTPAHADRAASDGRAREGRLGVGYQLGRRRQLSHHHQNLQRSERRVVQTQHHL